MKYLSILLFSLLVLTVTGQDDQSFKRLYGGFISDLSPGDVQYGGEIGVNFSDLLTVGVGVTTNMYNDMVYVSATNVFELGKGFFAGPQLRVALHNLKSTAIYPALTFQYQIFHELRIASDLNLLFGQPSGRICLIFSNFN